MLMANLFYLIAKMHHVKYLSCLPFNSIFSCLPFLSRMSSLTIFLLSFCCFIWKRKCRQWPAPARVLLFWASQAGLAWYTGINSVPNVCILGIRNQYYIIIIRHVFGPSCEAFNPLIFAAFIYFKSLMPICPFLIKMKAHCIWSFIFT